MWNPFSRKDDHGQSAPFFNVKHRVECDLAKMLGLAKEVLFDGVVSEEEALRLLERTHAHLEVTEH